MDRDERERDRRDRAEKARQALRLLDEPIFTEALDGVESDAIESMLDAETDEERREHRDTVKAIRSTRAKLRKFVDAGQTTDTRKVV